MRPECAPGPLTCDNTQTEPQPVRGSTVARPVGCWLTEHVSEKRERSGLVPVRTDGNSTAAERLLVARLGAARRWGNLTAVEYAAMSAQLRNIRARRRAREALAEQSAAEAEARALGHDPAAWDTAATG